MEKLAFVACVSAVVLIASPPAIARNATPPSMEITAVGELKRHHGRLKTWGPDAAGNFRASVNVSDLDLASDTGWSQASARVKSATSNICLRVTSDDRIPGYPVASWHGCVADVRAQMVARLEEARDAVRTGKRLALTPLRHDQPAMM